MKSILDPASGSRKFYFDKNNSIVLFGDIRDESYVQCDSRILNVHPDQKMDFRKLPFEDNSFSLVVFDPPHLYNLGENSFMAQSYGVLNKDTWKEDLAKGFQECWRVLKPQGTLVFKWADKDIPLTEILELFKPIIPIFGDKKVTSPKTGVSRFWLVFFKSELQDKIQLTKDEALLIMRMLCFFLQMAQELKVRNNSDVDPAKKLKNNIFHQIMDIEEKERDLCHS